MRGGKWVVIRLLLAGLLGGVAPAAAQERDLVPCLTSSQCPAGMRCNWGLCEEGMLRYTGALFQISVLDVPDLTLAAGTYRLREQIAAGFAGALEQTGLIGTVRHGGAFPVDTQTVFKALERGSAYLLSSHIAAFDGVEITLQVQLLDAETGALVEEVSGTRTFAVSRLGPALEEWVNGAVEVFTGRPGILGSHIACVRKLEQGIKEVYVLTYGRGDLRQVTFDKSLALLPSWTPDGRVAYTSYRSGRPMIYIEEREPALVSFKGMNTGIAWSPDGSVAAVTLSKDDNSEVYLLEGTTGEERARLTFHPGIDTSPTWSPDGEELAFVTDRDGSPQIWRMKASGANKERLTFSGGYNTSPEWHPFGPHLLYASRVGRHFQVFRLDLADGAVHQLTDGPGDCEAPDWSPDGRLVVCVCGPPNEQEVYVMNPDGSNARRITIDGGPYSAPKWQR